MDRGSLPQVGPRLFDARPPRRGQPSARDLLNAFAANGTLRGPTVQIQQSDPSMVGPIGGLAGLMASGLPAGPDPTLNAPEFAANPLLRTSSTYFGVPGAQFSLPISPHMVNQSVLQQPLPELDPLAAEKARFVGEQAQTEEEARRFGELGPPPASVYTPYTPPPPIAAPSLPVPERPEPRVNPWAAGIGALAGFIAPQGAAQFATAPIAAAIQQADQQHRDNMVKRQLQLEDLTRQHEQAIRDRDQFIQIGIANLRGTDLANYQTALGNYNYKKADAILKSKAAGAAAEGTALGEASTKLGAYQRALDDRNMRVQQEAGLYQGELATEKMKADIYKTLLQTGAKKDVAAITGQYGVEKTGMQQTGALERTHYRSDKALEGQKYRADKMLEATSKRIDAAIKRGGLDPSIGMRKAAFITEARTKQAEVNQAAAIKKMLLDNFMRLSPKLNPEQQRLIDGLDASINQKQQAVNDVTSRFVAYGQSLENSAPTGPAALRPGKGSKIIPLDEFLRGH